MRLATLKKKIEKNLKIKIDFRSDVYTSNAYGASPIINYDKAKNIINEAIKILEVNKMRVNTNMILNSIQTNSLKNELENLIFNASEESI